MIFFGNIYYIKRLILHYLTNCNSYTIIILLNVPFFPNFYAVYKKDKLTLSFGFGPNGGGGTADFLFLFMTISAQFYQISTL